jgi:hypothetical protein
MDCSREDTIGSKCLGNCANSLDIYPVHGWDELAAYNGSAIAERTNGGLGLRCDMEEANFLALNLLHDIVIGIKGAAQTQPLYAAVMREKKLTDDLQGLRFQAPRTAQGDPD